MELVSSQRHQSQDHDDCVPARPIATVVIMGKWWFRPPLSHDHQLVCLLGAPSPTAGTPMIIRTPDESGCAGGNWSGSGMGGGLGNVSVWGRGRGGCGRGSVPAAGARLLGV